MANQSFFIAGTHGVGKNALAHRFSQHLDLPSHSLSHSVTESNDTSVSRIHLNNVHNCIHKQNSNYRHGVILEGNLCSFTSGDMFEALGFSAFNNLNIQLLFLLTCEPDVIIDRLYKRHLKMYSLDKIKAIQSLEKKTATQYSKRVGIPLIEIDTTYGFDVEPSINAIKNRLFKHNIAS